MVHIVSVKGRTNIALCEDCKTFVSKAKKHTEAECRQRILNKANPKRRTGKATKTRKYRLTDKRRDQLENLISTAAGGNLKKADAWRRKLGLK